MLTFSSTGIPAIIGYTLGGVAVIYQIVALSVIALWRYRKPARPAIPRPVSILKPLCGEEPYLYENLRSFCLQKYPCYQIVFGVREPDDPALAVVEHLRREFPNVNMTVVIGSVAIGSNLKVCNLLNMLPSAKHDWLVLADSDIVVDPDYLENLVAPLGNTDIGIVTCLYAGIPINGIWSQLGALFINDWFFPSVLVARAFGFRTFAFGATIALRRETLIAIGGFEATLNSLADDYRLGELTRGCGLRTELSGYIVRTTVPDQDLCALWNREIRWSRTIRNLRPIGYIFSLITHSLLITAFGVLLTGGSLLSLLLLTASLLLRLMQHFMVERTSNTTNPLSWRLIPLRDTLTFIEWCASFGRHVVRWREQRLSLRADGSAEIRSGDSP